MDFSLPLLFSFSLCLPLFCEQYDCNTRRARFCKAAEERHWQQNTPVAIKMLDPRELLSWDVTVMQGVCVGSVYTLRRFAVPVPILTCTTCCVDSHKSLSLSLSFLQDFIFISQARAVTRRDMPLKSISFLPEWGRIFFHRNYAPP